MPTLIETYNARLNQLKELANQVYEELYAIDQVKGFQDNAILSPDHFADFILDTFRGHYMKNTYNIDWDETKEIYCWLKSFSYGPPKPPPKPVVHNPLSNTFRFADVVSGHTVYDENYNIVRYINGQGNWVERTPNGDFVIIS